MTPVTKLEQVLKETLDFIDKERKKGSIYFTINKDFADILIKNNIVIVCDAYHIAYDGRHINLDTISEKEVTFGCLEVAEINSTPPEYKKVVKEYDILTEEERIIYNIIS